MKLVCVGDCGIDRYEPEGHCRPGGITLNFALHARRCLPDDGICIVTAVGTDPAGSVVRAAIDDTGTAVEVATLQGQTPVQHIALGADGERQFVGYVAGVLERFRPTSAQRALIEVADWVVAPHFVQIAALFDALLALPRRGRMAVDFADFSDNPDFGLLQTVLPQIDVAFFGLDAHDTDTVAAIGRLAATHDKLLVVTLAAAGSRAYDGARVYRCDAVPVETIVDTTGAGDAFAAGFLSRYCHGAAVPDCLDAGARNASRVIRHLGGTDFTR